MPPSTEKTTVYKSYVFYNLPRTVSAGQGVYNYSELAALVGLKPTQHFKKRVRELVALGKLTATPCFTPAGGLELRFSQKLADSTEELPF